jgi:hypothetical protein
MTIRAPLAGAWLALGAAALSAQTPRADRSVKAIVTAASAYVDSYNPKMQNVLADEVAVQRVLGPGGVQEQTRTTRADFFLTYVPADTTWIAVRDVRDVDGTPVDDPDNVRVLMQRAPLWRMGSVIAEKNSRFNIGAITRTFNEPTLALLVVTSKHRARFKFDKIGGASGAAPRVTVAFKEHDRPTLVSGTNGAPAFSSGEIVIDATTGRIEHTVVQFVLGTITARIETLYAEDAKLKLWVPSVMQETYTQTSKGLELTIKCVSTYTNYRKFETSAIIK